MKRIIYSVISIFLFLSVSAVQSYAIKIGVDAFGPEAVVESFEGLTAGPNIVSDGDGYLIPGSISEYTLPSGVIFTNPVPNHGRGSAGCLVCDWTIGPAFWGIMGSGTVSSAADVPFGSAFMGLDVYSGGLIEFTFSTDMLRAGAYITGAPDITGAPSTMTMSAYDAGGNLLETQNITSVNISAWGDNFLGIENSNGIRRITFSGLYPTIDGLTFEKAAVTAIPTLSEWGMIIFSLLLVSFSVVLIKKQSGIGDIA